MYCMQLGSESSVFQMNSFVSDYKPQKEMLISPHMLTEETKHMSSLWSLCRMFNSLEMFPHE